jgi:hypothetical protein
MHRLKECVVMTQNDVVVRRTTSWGDAAVSGVLAGVIAGSLMAAYLALTGWLVGAGAAMTLARFDPVSGDRALVGLLAHLAMSAVLGAGYGLLANMLVRRSAWPGWLTGLLYGLALWALSKLVVLPAAGSPLLEVPALHWALAHVLYGLSLGWLVGRHERGVGG